jgi:DNA-binding IclR family transcriptional regulator
MGKIQTHQSLNRGLRIIEIIAAADSPLSLAEITRKIELSKSTVYNLLRALVDFEYLVQTENERTYTLAPKLFHLTEPKWTMEQLAEISKPFLEKLRITTKEGTSVAVINDDVVTIVAKCDSEGPVRVVQKVGATRPIYCTSVGKILSAWLPKKELDDIISHTVFEKMTPHTITTASAFRTELVKVRETGVAIDNEEYIKDIRCIAAPVRDHSGKVRVALAVVSPKNNLSQQRLTEVHNDLIAEALNFSARLGYEQKCGL